MRFFFALIALITSIGVADEQRPNIVLVMCDDLGWGDVGFNGNEVIQTPNLDQMAANGLNLTRFYAQAPVCSPTRASVVIGRHHDRTGIYTANKGHLRASEFTIYEALKTKGYTTGHFGKWHMGTMTKKVKESNRGANKPEDYSPCWEHGVDVTFATEAKTPTFDPMWKPAKKSGTAEDFTIASRQGWNALTAESKKEPYGTHYWTAEETMVPPESDELMGDDSAVIMNRALSFIEDNAEQPFFTIVWFHAPHLPVVASQEDVALYADHPGTDFDKNYFGCVTALDRAIGDLRTKLRDLGIADNTMVAFCSDNGPEGSDKSPGRAAEFRGRKRSLYEGGVRVPSLIEWPAVVKAGSESDVTSCTVDYFQTIQEIVGFEMPDDRELDGVSLLPLLKGEMQERGRPLGFHIVGKAAWHDGDWKLVKDGNKKDWELYDLGKDPEETKNLAEQKPKRFEAMQKAWGEWYQSVQASDQASDQAGRGD